ncbi:hypothetical protein ACWD48_28445, partial [Streptomyces sp. NPDC002519]
GACGGPAPAVGADARTLEQGPGHPGPPSPETLSGSVSVCVPSRRQTLISRTTTAWLLPWETSYEI